MNQPQPSEHQLTSQEWRLNNLYHIVSKAGIVIPFRMNCPGEVVLVTLRRGPKHVSVGGCSADLW